MERLRERTVNYGFTFYLTENSLIAEGLHKQFTPRPKMPVSAWLTFPLRPVVTLWIDPPRGRRRRVGKT